MVDRSVVVKLIADNASFDATMGRSSKKVEDIGTSADRAAKVAKSAFDQIKVAGASLLGIAALKSGQDLINLQQSAQVAFTSITGSAQTASAAIQQIYTWDQTNPIPFQNALAAGQKLAAFGVDMKDVVPTLQAIADATGAVGGSADTFDRIALALGQIQTKGKLSAEEMLQLAEAGLPAWKILADAIGTTIPDAMKRAERGTIDADTALEALRQGIETRFPNAAQNLKNTTLGAWQSLTAGIRDGAKSILEPLQGIESQSALTAGALVRNLGTGIGTTLQGLTSVLSGVTAGLSGVATAAGAVPPPITAMGLAMVGTHLASTQLASGWDTLRIRGLYALDAFRSFGTTIAGLSGRFTSLSAAAATGRTALSALASAGAAAGSKLMGFFGGPLGFAIVGATTLMSAWGDSQQKAQQQEAEHQAQLSALKDTLDKVSGAITAATTASITQDWSKSGGLADQMRQLGINSNLAIHAVTQGGPAMAAFRKQIIDQATAAFQASDQWGMFSDALKASGKTADQFARDQVQSLITITDAYGSAGIKAGSDLDVVGSAVSGLMKVYTDVTDTQKMLGQGAHENQQAFELFAGTVADTAGVSKDKLIPALDAAKSSGGSVEKALLDAGFSIDQVNAIIPQLGSYVMQGAGNFHVMAGAATAAGAALQGVGDDAAEAAAKVKAAQQAFLDTQKAADSMVAGMINSGLQLRQQIQGALTSFIDPVSAWSTASDAVNRRVSVSSNPAVKAADAAVKAGRKRADATKKSAADEKDAAVKAAQAIRDAITAQNKASEKLTKDAQTDAQKRVDAAKKEVSDLKALADQQKKDAQDAANRLQQAKFDLASATLNRERAAAGLAAAETPIERANWQSAYNSAVRDEAAAKQAASSAQSSYDVTTQRATASQQGLSRATREQESAEQQLAQAKSDAAAAAEVATKRQQAADATLADAKAKADARYQKAVDAAQAMLQALIDKQDAAKESAQTMANGSADAVTGMVAKVAPSFAQWMTQLEQQKKAQDEWANNLRGLASKLPGDVVAYLAGLGPSAAGMIAAMNSQSTAELGKAVPLLRSSMPQWTDAITNGILAGIPGTAASAAQLGDDTLNAMMAELQKGDRPLSQILANYGVIMQQAADGTPVFLRVGVDTSQVAAGLYNAAIQAQNDLANFYGAAYNPVTYWGQGAHFASGGMVGDGWFWTGEQGPELGFKQGPNVRIFPAPQSAAMAPPAPAPVGSGTTIIINDNSVTNYPQGVPDSVARNRRQADFAAQVTMG